MDSSVVTFSCTVELESACELHRVEQRHITRITALLDGTNPTVTAEFDRFLDGLRGNLNDNLSRADAIDMLAQHLITRPVFDALFGGYDLPNQRMQESASPQFQPTVGGHINDRGGCASDRPSRRRLDGWTAAPGATGPSRRRASEARRGHVGGEPTGRNFDRWH